MRWWLVCVCVVLSLWSVERAHAQAGSADPVKSAAARSLFEEGVALTDAGNWTEAADRFRRALALRDSQVIRYNLAAALIETGKLIEGSELLREVERDTTVEAKLRSDARARLDAVTPRIAKLTIRLEGSPDDATVLLDNRPLDGALIGVGMPADPGMHRVRAQKNGQDVDAKDVELADGASEVIVLRTEPPAPVVATPAEAAATVATMDAGGPRKDAPERRRKALWWGIGAGAVAVVAIAVVSVLVATSKGDSEKTYEGDFDPPSLPVSVGP